MRPQAYFIRRSQPTPRVNCGSGPKPAKDESGFYAGAETARLERTQRTDGSVVALSLGANADMWMGTDGRGVFHFSAAKKIERFTFDEQPAGLRSDHVYAIFVDREEVVWFGTDRGVSRFDPHARERNRCRRVGKATLSALFTALWMDSCFAVRIAACLFMTRRPPPGIRLRHSRETLSTPLAKVFCHPI